MQQQPPPPPGPPPRGLAPIRRSLLQRSIPRARPLLLPVPKPQGKDEAQSISSLTLQSINSHEISLLRDGAGNQNTALRNKGEPGGRSDETSSKNSTKKLSPYVVQVGNGKLTSQSHDPKESSSSTRSTSELPSPQYITQAKLHLQRQQDFDAKLQALLKERTLRLAKAGSHHELALENVRRIMFAQRARHLQDENSMAFEFTQRLQSLSAEFHKRLSNVEAGFRLQSSQKRKKLVQSLSQLREQLADRSGSWKEMMDPGTGSVYYLDLDTGHSQWQRPNEMDATSDDVASVTCAICLDVANYPASCRNGHIFCSECLRSHLEVAANSTCPTCRVLIQANQDGVSYGVRNLLAESLTEKLRKAGKGSHHEGVSEETEEELLAMAKNEQLKDLRDLELSKRELSSDMRKQAAQIRRDFEEEWEQRSRTFQNQLQIEGEKLEILIKTHEKNLENIEEDMRQKVAALEAEFRQRTIKQGEFKGAISKLDSSKASGSSGPWSAPLFNSHLNFKFAPSLNAPHQRARKLSMCFLLAVFFTMVIYVIAMFASQQKAMDEILAGRSSTSSKSSPRDINIVSKNLTTNLTGLLGSATRNSIRIWKHFQHCHLKTSRM